MSQITTVPGAGTLRGSEFLLFSDWKMLGDQPGLNLFEQTNKARDILIKIAVIVEEDDGIDAGLKEDIDALKCDLEVLRKEYLDFGSLDGSIELENEYQVKLDRLFYHLFKIQRELEIIETTGQERLGVPPK